MGLINNAVCLMLFISQADFSTLRNELESEKPAFVRSAVESVPQIDDEDHSARFSLRPTFGEIFLPLRSAVETVPTVRSDDSYSGKTFLRSSVESPPEYEELTQDEEIFKLQPPEKLAKSTAEDVELLSTYYGTDDYSAFVEPNQDIHFLPQPYRSGSPYQQIVTAEEIELQRENEARLALLKSGPATKKKNLNRSPQVLCYFTNWAFYRHGDGKFVPENVDVSLCTAVIYSFASLDPDLLTIKEFDPWVDVDNEYYKRVTAIKVPVLIALGGWTDSTGDKYSRLAADEIKRNVFASSVTGFLQRHGFKGLHLDWNYPKCWQSDCKSGPSSDKPNFTKLIKALRTEFDRVDKNLLLGAAISGYQEIILEAYELAELSKHVNYLTVMSYDYHGAWEMQTGHVSPLYGRKGDKYPQYNTDYAMQLLIRNGAAPEKIIMGIPFYGQTFTLEDVSNKINGEGLPSSGPGEPGEFTKQPGMMAYYEICQRIRKNKWQVARDPERKSGPYAFLRTQWVGYEDPSSVEAKARYAANSGFAGVAAWTIDLDDFQNRCCSEAFPLLKAINRALGRLEGAPPSVGSNCVRPPQPSTPVPPVMTTASDSGGGSGSNYDSTTWPSWEATTSTTVVPDHIHSSNESTTTTTPRTTTTTRKPVTTKPTRRTTTSQPIESTTIPAPALIQPIMVTSNCRAGEFLPHPNNCNAYYHCVADGELSQQFCAGGLHWNRENNYCDWPATAQCKVTPPSTRRPNKSTSRPIQENSGKPSTTSHKTTPPTTTTIRTIQSDYHTTTKPIVAVKPSKPPPPRPQRPRKCKTGQFWPHRNCGQYYVCVNEMLIPNNCGNDLQWNHEKKICDWPSNVKCVSTKKYLRLIHSKASESDPCEGKNFVPYPGDCSRYLRCNWDRLEAADCSPGLHWNPNLDICDWPSNANCKQSEIGLDEEVNVIDAGDNNVEPADPLGPTPTSTTVRPVKTPKPTFPTDKPQLEPLDGYYKVVCYFTNWAWYRKGVGRYTPDDINTDLCTHIVYGFAVLDYSELTIRTHDSWADIDNKFYTRVADLKSKGVKVTLALGGWNDSQGDKYSRLVRNPSARAKFVKQAVDFLERYGFQGLDLDWEYPVCWQTECNKGVSSEKEGFTAWVRELSEAFKPKGLLLSTAVSPSKKIIDAGYDVAVLARYFDWIAVMTYDFHGQWDKKTGHVAPLYSHPEDEFDYFNANFSINYWIEKGAPSRKIIMGMPLYGQSFTLANSKDNGLNAKAPGPGQAGEITRSAGFLAYYEICDRVKNQGWEVVQDEKGRMGPFARKGNQWVSFDDPAMLRKKSQLVRALDLGGGMIWALDLDDFKNRCGDGVHPLLTQIHDVLKSPPSDYEPTPGLMHSFEPAAPPESIETIESAENTQSNEQHTSNVETIEQIQSNEEVPENIETIDNSDNEIPNDPYSETEEMGSFEIESETDLDFKVICYFTNWAWYRQGGGKFVPEDIDADLCTHIVYGFAVLNRETLTIKPHDSWADIDNKFYDRITSFKAKKVKVTVAIGGWNDSAGDKYARLVKDPASRARFIEHVIEFIEKYNFDGLDLDWEYPVCWQVDCNKGSPDEKEGFTSLVREISKSFKPRGLLLSSAVSPNKKVIDAGYDVPELSRYFDWIAVMTYDFHGQWDKKTGHISPMYDHPDDDPTFNSNFSINYWISQGADRRKIVMGMPMYGQSFSLAEAKSHDLNAPTYGGGEAGEATRARGFLSYYEICSNIRAKKWQVVRDPRGRMGPYAYLRDQWVSFDDVPMIRHKSEYVKAMGLGGAMIWALDLDDFKNKCDCESYPLLKTINRVLRKYPGSQPQCKLEDKSEISNLSSNGDSYLTPSVEITTQQAPVIVLETSLKPEVHSESQEAEDIIDMSCHGKNFLAHKKDCNKYYICQYGGLIEQRCPDGLHWNENYCDWPQNTQCTISDAGTTTQRPKPVNKPSKKPILATTKKPTSLPTKKPDKKHPSIKPSEDERYKVVCYFTNWAWYRQGEGKYVPEDIDENLCTHIVYGFAVLNRDSLTIKTHDSWADIDNRFYDRVVAYKEKGIRVTVAIGGWNDSLGNKYARLVLDPLARARFIKSVLDFVNKYGFQGLDLDWEYPVCWQVDCKMGSSEEKAGFASLVRELSEEFKPRGLLLSSAVSPSKKVIDAGYDVPQLARYFDWIAVMTYDFHGHWDKQTGHVAPLYYVDGDSNDYYNANFSMHYWIEQGTPPQKLVMGMPMYGQSFSLADTKSRGLNEKTYGPGEAGKFTRAAGFLAYYEICENVNSGGWTVVRDEKGRIGPYAYRGNQWVSYDDVGEIRRKSEFIKSLGLGGGMVWALDLDDFRGRCGCGKHPLLRTLNQELRGISGQRASDCT